MSKKINTHAKGKKLEVMVRKYYEAQGWVIHQAVSTGTKRGPIFVSNTNDIFECIDLVCKHPDYDYTMWLQITTKNVGIGRKTEALEKIPWNNKIDKVAVVQHYPAKDNKWGKGGFFVFRWREEDYQLFKDEDHILFETEIKELLEHGED